MINDNKVEINDGHYLELMDRLHIVMSTIDNHIVTHPLAENEPEIQKKLEDAFTLLWDAYQMVGNKMPE